MATRQDGGAAFPTTVHPNSADGSDGMMTGMSLRDWFAGQALAGLLANSGGPIQANEMSGWNYTNCGTDTIARLAYALSDAMLAERSKP